MRMRMKKKFFKKISLKLPNHKFNIIHSKTQGSEFLVIFKVNINFKLFLNCKK